MKIKYVLLGIILVILIAIIIFQVIEIKKMKKSFKNIDNIAKKLYCVSEQISKINDEDKVLSLILDAAVELISNAEKGSILILEDDDRFHYKVLKGYPNVLKELVLNKNEVHIAKINSFKGTAIIKDPHKFNEGIVGEEKYRILKKYNALDISCILCSPIYINKRLIGIINVDSIKSNYTFTEDDLKVMNYITNELQLALENSINRSKLNHMANYDELTGLINRRRFNNIFEHELKDILRYKWESCVALIDIDNFKGINDTYGHNVGDRALKHFAQVLRKNIRVTDIYARISGDEFVLLFVKCTKKKASERLEVIQKELKRNKINDIQVSFSYGIAEINYEHKETVEEILVRADKEMYKNKKYKYIKSPFR